MSKRTPRQFLESMSTMDSLVDHKDNCGHCETQRIMAQVARDLLTECPDAEDVVEKWGKEYERRWHDSKYYKLYQEEVAAGRDPHKAFDERGWEM